MLGGGPAGYVAAIRAAQLGMRVAVVERESVGGVCLHWGCIPTKALLHVADVYNDLRRAGELGIRSGEPQIDYAKAHARSRQAVRRLASGAEHLLAKAGVELIQGTGLLSSAESVEVQERGIRVQARNIILATGARSKPLPGVTFDGQRILSHRHALELQRLPPSMVIVGAGASGVEFAYLFASLGCKVTLAEMENEILPREDAEIAAVVRKGLLRLGVKVLTQARAESVRAVSGGVELLLRRGDEAVPVEAEKALVATGFSPNVEGIGLEAVGVATANGAVVCDERMATSVPSIYAAGDVTGPPYLAHLAFAQGVAAAEAIGGGRPAVPPSEDVSRAVFAQPNLISVGLTQAQAAERGLEVNVGRFPFAANGRAVSMGHPEGIVKVVLARQSGEILGIQAAGYGIAELVGEIAALRGLRARAEDLLTVTHFHPTMAEALGEALLDAQGRALHK